MVLLTATQYFNAWLGPRLLRQSVRLRYRVDGGVLRDRPLADQLLGLTWAQQLVKTEVRHGLQAAEQTGRADPHVLDHVFFRKDEVEDGQAKEEASPADLRRTVLESWMRPSLLPSNQWQDVRHWQFHFSLLKWARQEYLWVAHQPHVKAAMQVYPSLAQSWQLQDTRSSLPSWLTSPSSNHEFSSKVPWKDRLPTNALLVKALGLEEWAATAKDRRAERQRMRQLAKQCGGEVLSLYGGHVVVASLPLEADLSALTWADVLEVAGGHVAHGGPLNTLCEELNLYQIWTQEYIQGLGDYLQQRCQQLSGPVRILDLGAGDGLLTLFLKDYLEQQSCDVELIATDDASWKIAPKAPVEGLSVDDALKQYASDDDTNVIVLCSWMPMNVDWSHKFRQHRVAEYILIGESDDGQCGDNWLTWGNPHFHPDASPDDDVPLADSVAPFEQDGYQRTELKALKAFQWSRFDTRLSKNATTVSFRRGD